MISPEIDLKLPYITENLPGVGGKIKQKPENFIVNEIPLYFPEGKGKHVYVNITKKNKTTREVQLELANLFQLRPHNIGHAGLKDKKAVTTQTFSILVQNVKVPIGKISDLIEQNYDIKVNWTKLHTNKLRTGHLLGNKFRIRITDIDMPINLAFDLTLKITNKIHKTGLPNYYGEQRTGKGGENIISGCQILHGDKWIQNKWLRRYLISCYQSYLCNMYLKKRIKRNLFCKILVGDIAKKHNTGGIFLVDNQEKAQLRLLNKEISYTAPIYGYKMPETKWEAKKLEDEVFRENSITMEALRKHHVAGTRRIGRMVPEILVEKINEDLLLEFCLPKGSFATVVLREYMKKNR
jgi:tRNA pseudouridine13 synthase